ncbi:MAG: hypothetical protein E7491_09925 [Ruminococcaceae bacterium]|nr:hypothetical protein [Oscillospiraceae bacterium]
MKRIISILTVLVMLFALVSCGAESSGQATPTPEPTQQATPTDTPSPTPVKDTTGMTQLEIDLGLDKYVPTTSFKLRPGLYMENGTLMHEGEPYASIGVNYVSGLQSCFLDPLNGFDDCDRVYSILNEYGIDYCRVFFGVFWPNDYKLMLSDMKTFYAFWDKAVQKAEEYGIGLICSVFFNFEAVSDCFDEPRSAWYDPESQTRKFMTDYTTTVVNRYKDSPAIWGWEFSNEVSLSADLPNRADFHGETTTQHLGTRPYRDENDDIFTDKMFPVMAQWAELVRELDPYDRILSTGNSEPRPSQWHQYKYNTWQRDTESQMSEIFLLQNPDPYDTMSIHTYELLERFEGSETFEGLFTAYNKVARENGKALFIGEFSGYEKEPHRQNAEVIIDAIVATQTPLSCVWVMGGVGLAADTSLDDVPELRAQILGYIQQANEKLAESIKNN